MKTIIYKLKESNWYDTLKCIASAIMVFAIGLFFMAIIIGCATPTWKWTKQNTVLETINFSVNVADFLQTRKIANNPDRGFYEKNPLLGRHPTVGQVNTIFPLLYLAKLGITIITPNPYRCYIQGLWIGLSGETVRENWEKGIK